MNLVALMLAQLERLACNDKMLVENLIREPETLCRMSRDDLRDLLGKELHASFVWNPDRLLAGAEVLAQKAESRFWKAVSISSGAYPALLRSINRPPYLLWFAGTVPASETFWVPVVGTRQPGEEGRRAAWSLGEDCAALGLGHVSGLAFGIDAASHGGAVHRCGLSMAILPGGLDCLSPRSHSALAMRICAQGGALCSEFLPGVEAAPWRYAIRNRIIAGLARFTIVVEAPEKSGALLTAGYALAEGRDVWVHPAGLRSLRGAGTRRLCTEGARTYLTMGEVVNEYGQSDSGIRAIPQGHP